MNSTQISQGPTPTAVAGHGSTGGWLEPAKPPRTSCPGYNFERSNSCLSRVAAKASPSLLACAQRYNARAMDCSRCPASLNASILHFACTLKPWVPQLVESPALPPRMTAPLARLNRHEGLVCSSAPQSGASAAMEEARCCVRACRGAARRPNDASLRHRPPTGSPSRVVGEQDTVRRREEGRYLRALRFWLVRTLVRG